MRNTVLSLLSLAALGLAGCGTSTTAAPPAAVQQAPNIQTYVNGSPAASPNASPVAAASVAPSAAAQPVTISLAQAPDVEASPSVPPKPAVAIMATPDAIRLPGFVYIRQTLNNCGPASIAEVLHYWGVEQTQDQARVALRSSSDDRGMWPYPVPAYVGKLGMASLMGVNGTPEMIKALVANGFPVILAEAVSATDRTAHYREIEGFDDNAQTFVSTDSYLGPNHTISYDENKKIWTGNQRFMVIYPPDKQPVLDAVLASVNWNKDAVYQADLQKLLHPELQRPDQFQQVPPGFNNTFRKGMSQMSFAWDYIQLGQFDKAQDYIQQAAAQGPEPQMLSWIKSALATAQASAATA
ncbi:MAG: C39 family peptidase [Chloroflexi bacterium]|nr:C39 family peptidase [Chloroflexota bacterium]